MSQYPGYDFTPSPTNTTDINDASQQHQAAFQLAQAAMNASGHSHAGGSSSGAPTLPQASPVPVPPPGLSASLQEAFTSSPFSKHLGRNRACAACRERKLKCDGSRPVCGQCARAWATKRKSLVAKGHSEAEVAQLEVPCQYLALEPKAPKKPRGSNSAASAGGSSRKRSAQPMEDIERLQMEVDQLREQLRGARAGNATADASQRFGADNGHAQMHRQHEQVHGGLPMPSHYQQATSDELSIAEILATTMRAGDGNFSRAPSVGPAPPPGVSFDGLPNFGDMNAPGSLAHMGIDVPPNIAGTNIYSHPLHPAHPHGNPLLDPMMLGPDGNGAGHSTSGGGNSGAPDPMLELVFSGWPSDFPPPATVDTLVRIFFESFPYFCIFHPGRFMASLSLGPQHPRYPNPAVLHAMFALSYTLRPEIDPMPTVHGGATQMAAQVVMDAMATTGSNRTGSRSAYGGASLSARLAKESLDERSRIKGGGSSNYHSARAQHHITHGTWEGGDLYDMARATSLLCNKKYSCGELLEAWLLSAHSTRLLVGLSINRTRRPSGKTQAPLVDVTRLSMAGPAAGWIEEEERRRTAWLIFGTDRSAAATTLWASSLAEEDMSVDMPIVPQEQFLAADLTGVDYSNRQNAQSPDLFTGRHHDSFVLLCKAFVLLGRCGSLLARLPAEPTEADLLTPAFHQLDNQISSFAMSFPSHLQSVLVLDRNGKPDVCLLTSHAIPHCARLMLHDPMVHTRDESNAMCRAACAGVLGILRLLSATGAELALFPAIFAFIIALTGKNVIRRFQRAFPHGRDAPTPSDGGKSNFSGGATASTPAPGSTSAGGGDVSDWSSMRSAGQAHEAEELAKSEIDLVIRSLCKYGAKWPIGLRQAQALCGQLGMSFKPEQMGNGSIWTHQAQQQPQPQRPPTGQSNASPSASSQTHATPQAQHRAPHQLQQQQHASDQLFMGDY